MNFTTFSFIFLFLNPASHVIWKLMKATHHVRWQTHVNLLGVGKVEVAHQGDELFPGLRQARVVFLLLPNGGCCLPLVAVCRVKGGVVREGQDPGPDRAIQGVSTITLEVCPAATSHYQSISCKSTTSLSVNIGD